MLTRPSALPIASMLATVSVVCAGVGLAPAAMADSSSVLRDAVAALRDSSSCGALQYNPTAEKAAEITNVSSRTYLEQAARAVPVEDALPVLKDLGYGGNKATLLRGSFLNSDSSAITGALIQGYALIPDCSFTEFGVNMMQSATTGYSFATVVLAGP